MHNFYLYFKYIVQPQILLKFPNDKQLVKTFGIQKISMYMYLVDVSQNYYLFLYNICILVRLLFNIRLTIRKINKFYTLNQVYVTASVEHARIYVFLDSFSAFLVNSFDFYNMGLNRENFDMFGNFVFEFNYCDPIFTSKNTIIVWSPNNKIRFKFYFYSKNKKKNALYMRYLLLKLRYNKKKKNKLKKMKKMWENLKFKFYKMSISYPVPININVFWNFGILAFFFLICQILTGIFLAMHYVPNVDMAYSSVEHIMRDVNLGWFVRYLHSNGASMFFLVTYIHIFRGLYYNSFVYPRATIWIFGIIILLLMIITAFLGYVLPWGQMSFWAATVITNLASAIPFIGNDIVIWLWGGFSVGNPTLNRFYSLHYILPIIIVVAVMIHVVFLHFTLSNNPLGTPPDTDEVSFGIYFIIKDIVAIFLILIVCGIFLWFNPNLLSHSDNYIQSNPLVTPNHIVPEWYFLPFYAILRSVPNKLFGVILLLASILVLIILPFIVTSEVRNTNYKTRLRMMFWVFLCNCIVLGWIGSKDIVTPYYEIGQICTVFYFAYFLVWFPLMHKKI